MDLSSDDIVNLSSQSPKKYSCIDDDDQISCVKQNIIDDKTSIDNSNICCQEDCQYSDSEDTDSNVIFPIKQISPTCQQELEHLLKSNDEDENDPVSALLDPYGQCNGLLGMPRKALDQAEELARRVWEAGWTVVHHNSLPKWLRDNECLVKGHRPPLNSFWACFKSIFRVHTETGNIWTHLLGFLAFIGISTYFLSRSSSEIQYQEKVVFSPFFAGVILCLGFSFIFHTVHCHSENVGKLFNKLDYCGIALLTMGSFIPWLYYSFYCRIEPKIIYIILIFVLGAFCIVVSMWDKFAQPKFRPIRAGMFIGLGLSGIIPLIHFIITDGFYDAFNKAALGWLLLMALLYISGAIIYAMRFPEKVWPGKFDIWFQSHQIFHIFVVAAAFVHYHGISMIAANRLTIGDCIESTLA